jgi:hypothetical protein
MRKKSYLQKHNNQNLTAGESLKTLFKTVETLHFINLIKVGFVTYILQKNEDAKQKKLKIKGQKRIK